MSPAPVVVSATASLKNAVVASLINLGKAGPFYRTRHGADGLPQDIDIDEEPIVAPSSVVADEISAAFEADENYGRAIAQRRAAWLFELHLEFNTAINAELFETKLMNPVPIVSVTGLPSVALRLTNVEYGHPPKQQASSGSSIVYTFDASAGRI